MDKPTYMVVAFVKNPKRGQIVLLKKNLHVSIKKKFDLKKISETQLIKEMQDIKFEFKNKKIKTKILRKNI